MAISFEPLWETMRHKGKTTYDLQVRWKIGGGTYSRIKKNLSVSTNTIDDLCNHLDCEVQDIMVHVKETNIDGSLKVN